MAWAPLVAESRAPQQEPWVGETGLGPLGRSQAQREQEHTRFAVEAYRLEHLAHKLVAPEPGRIQLGAPRKR